MRCTVHPPRIFHNRITKRLGVLVGAALLIAFGLPSAVQAQTPNPPTPIYERGSDTFTLTPTGDAYAFSPPHSHWVYEYISPDGSPAWLAVVGTEMTNELSSLGVRGAEGTWQFRLKSILADVEASTDADAMTTGAVQISGSDPAAYVVPDKEEGSQSPWSSFVRLHARYAACATGVRIRKPSRVDPSGVRVG